MADATLHAENSQSEGFQQKVTRFLYQTPVGRAFLRVLVQPGLSKIVGVFLDTRLSRPLVAPFIHSHNIDIMQFEGVPFRTFNDCFSRVIKPNQRPIEGDSSVLVSPADSKLSVLPITSQGRMVLKGTPYTIESLLQDGQLATNFLGGFAFVFRLSVEDYHRYCFPAAGLVSVSRRIPGVLHTVHPLANQTVPIYKQNTREYVELVTEEFGTLLLMEVGAMLVGRIVNHPLRGAVQKGQEKGYFQYGGSTIVVLTQANMLAVDEALLEASSRGEETQVRYGQAVAQALK